MRALTAVVEAHGPPEVIGWREVDLPAPGPGEALVRVGAVGLNMIDTYHRRGIYPLPTPHGLGLEFAGVVEAVGDGVAAIRPGDRVGGFRPPPGAYASARLVPADALVPLPDDVDDETAAALLLKGCTAEFLVERCAKVEPGWPVLVHAAAGATGQLLVRWLRAIGARPIGTVSSAEKEAVAREAGAEAVIRYDREDVAARVRELTDGIGVPVVLDGVGKATWEASLGSLAKRGLLVSFGNASAPVGEVDLGVLARAGSLFTTRPTLFDYYATPEEARAGVERVWAMWRNGALRVPIGQRYGLSEAAEAHRALEARETVGATVLLP